MQSTGRPGELRLQTIPDFVSMRWTAGRESIRRGMQGKRPLIRKRYSVCSPNWTESRTRNVRHDLWRISVILMRTGSGWILKSPARVRLDMRQPGKMDLDLIRSFWSAKRAFPSWTTQKKTRSAIGGKHCADWLHIWKNRDKFIELGESIC